jgi:ABC-type multidrug transport system permease subunit
MIVGQNAVAQRFMGNLRLLVTMPMAKGAYVLGSLAFSSISGAVTVLVLLGFGVVTGIGIEPVWTLAPSLVLAVLTMAGLTMLVVSFAPTPQVGNIATGLLSLGLAALSPVYFTMEQAPVLLRFLGYVSPLRYAADAIEKSLSGRIDVWLELGVLAGFALVTMALGLWRLPWRER